MDYFFLYIFLGACASLLLWGMIQPSRVYQYPFLIGAIFAAFLVPQAIPLIESPGTVPRDSVDSALLMGALCMLMAWTGYQFAPLRSVVVHPARSLSKPKVMVAAYATTAISLFAGYFMVQIPEDEILTGTGLFTILSFFVGFSVVAFPIFLKEVFKRPNFSNAILTLISGYPIYSAMLFSGRRSQTAEFFLFVALMFYFQRKYVPGRVLALGLVLLVAYLIPTFAAVREDFWRMLLEGALGSIPFVDAMQNVMEGDTLELRNAAAMIYATELTGEYGYGTGYWDAIVFRYVPGQLVGFDLKEALQFKWGLASWDSFGYVVKAGTTYTAIADSFQQFGFFGSLFFMAQGYFFKNLWVLAAQQNSSIAQIAYVALVPFALVAVTHGSVWFLQGGLIIWIILYALYRFSRLPLRRSGSSLRPELSQGANNNGFVSNQIVTHEW